jgi:hypothetical protein
MRRRDLFPYGVKILFGVLFFVSVGGALRSEAQTVYLACTWDTSSIFKGKAGPEKFERRFYVSPVVSMSKEDFLRIDSQGDRIGGLCGDYLEGTVMKAAAEREEKLDPGGQLRVRQGIELSGEDLGSKNMYKFGTKEAVEKKRDEAIKDSVDFGRLLMNFNWDLTGKAEAADYAAEKKRVIPTPAPPVRKP